MTFAVTLHPFDEQDYVDRVLASAVGRKPPEHLASGLERWPDMAALARQLAPRMVEAYAALRAGDGIPWSTVLNFNVARLEAYRHPAYYLGDVGLSYWRAAGEAPMRPYTRSMSILAARLREVGAMAGDVREGFAGPSSAGSCISAGDVFLLIRDFERRPKYFYDRLEGGGVDARAVMTVVLEVLHYARERHLAILEATHVVDPTSHETLFPEGHLRGGWRGGLNPEVARRLDQFLRNQR